MNKNKLIEIIQIIGGICLFTFIALILVLIWANNYILTLKLLGTFGVIILFLRTLEKSITP